MIDLILHEKARKLGVLIRNMTKWFTNLCTLYFSFQYLSLGYYDAKIPKFMVLGPNSHFSFKF